jgi:hypothetical protein
LRLWTDGKPAGRRGQIETKKKLKLTSLAIQFPGQPWVAHETEIAGICLLLRADILCIHTAAFGGRSFWNNEN